MTQAPQAPQAPQPPMAPPPPYYYPPPVQLPNAPGAVSSLVCGIVGVVLCWTCLGGLILGIVAIMQSKKAKQNIAAYPGQYGGAGMATAGLVLGIIATALGGLYSIFWVIWMSAMGAFMSHL